MHARGGEIADLGHAHEPGAEMRLAGDLEPDVVTDLQTGVHQRREFVRTEDLCGVALDERHSFGGDHDR